MSLYEHISNLVFKKIKSMLMLLPKHGAEEIFIHFQNFKNWWEKGEEGVYVSSHFS